MVLSATPHWTWIAPRCAPQYGDENIIPFRRGISILFLCLSLMAKFMGKSKIVFDLIRSTLRKLHGPSQGLKWLFLVPNPYTGFFGRPAAGAAYGPAEIF